MQASTKAYDLIKRFEGCSLSAYPDPASELGQACAKQMLPPDQYTKVPNWVDLTACPITIGWGHTDPIVKLGHIINAEIADSFLMVDVRRAECLVNLLDGLNQNQYDALVSLAYNCPAALEVETTLNRMLRAKEWAKAAQQILIWDHAHKKEIPGLKRRREAEKDLFVTPISVTLTPS